MAGRRLSFKTRPQQTGWDALQRTWEAAEDVTVLAAGWLFDHFLPISTDDRDGSCFEGWTALSVLAGRTERLRLGLMVSGNTYRHPALLANMAATLDVASGGRLEIGLGGGWFEDEHRAYGIPFPPTRERLERLDEACAVVDALLTSDRATYAGRWYQLDDAPCQPRPVQHPRPPLVIGGQGERFTLRTVARWADEWNFPGTDPDALRAKHEVLAAHCADLGRDVEDIAVSVHVFCDGLDDAEVASRARGLVDAGADHVLLYLYAPFRPDALRPLAERVAEAIGVAP